MEKPFTIRSKAKDGSIIRKFFSILFILLFFSFFECAMRRWIISFILNSPRKHFSHFYRFSFVVYRVVSSYWIVGWTNYSMYGEIPSISTHNSSEEFLTKEILDIRGDFHLFSLFVEWKFLIFAKVFLIFIFSGKSPSQVEEILLSLTFWVELLIFRKNL